MLFFNSVVNSLVEDSLLVRIQLAHCNPVVLDIDRSEEIREQVIRAHREIKLIRQGRLDSENSFWWRVWGSLRRVNYTSAITNLTEAQEFRNAQMNFISDTLQPTILTVPIGTFEHWVLEGAVTILDAVSLRVVQHFNNLAADDALGPLDAFEHVL